MKLGIQHNNRARLATQGVTEDEEGPTTIPIYPEAAQPIAAAAATIVYTEKPGLAPPASSRRSPCLSDEEVHFNFFLRLFLFSISLQSIYGNTGSKFILVYIKVSVCYTNIMLPLKCRVRIKLLVFTGVDLPVKCGL